MKLDDVLLESHDDPNKLEAYAKKHGLGELSWAGSGDMGNAYYTEKDTILKITSDSTELAFAKKIVGKKLDNVVHIYDVEDDIIHMELLDEDGVEDVYGAASEYVEEYGYDGDFGSVDTDEIDGIPDEVEKFLHDMRWGMYELGMNGIDNLDLKDDNIGKRGNDFVIFDMSEKKRGMW
jgi:hypothetical protein